MSTKYPALAVGMMRMLGRQLQESQVRRAEISNQEVERRVANMLLRLAAHLSAQSFFHRAEPRLGKGLVLRDEVGILLLQRRHLGFEHHHLSFKRRRVSFQHARLHFIQAPSPLDDVGYL
jgi:CRP-like cAMP-binding protein